MHRHADADIDDLRRDSPPSGTQTNATGGFFFFSDATTTTTPVPSSPNGFHAPLSQIADPSISPDAGPNPVASTMSSHTSD